MNRRTFIVLCLGATALIATRRAFTPLAQAAPSTMVDNDPEAPVTGNPKGDVTIIEFSDYNCPFCKQSSAALEKLTADDGNIRVVHKDWPILSETSAFGARMALAAKYQGKYQAAHEALMTIPGPRIPQARMLQAVVESGVDMTRLEADLKAHGQDIAALLQRNARQAEELGLQGTPAFVIGPFLAASALDYDDFKQAVAEARAKAKG